MHQQGKAWKVYGILLHLLGLLLSGSGLMLSFDNCSDDESLQDG